MPLSSKTKTAITAMTDLAIHEVNGPVSLTTIAQRQNISISSLEQIFGRLRQCGLVNSVRGPGGGYSLCRNASTVRLAEVARIFEPSDVSTQGLDSPITQELWQHLKNHMFHLLDHVTLQSLVDKTPHTNSALKNFKPPRLSRGIGPMPTAKPRHTHITNSVFALGNLNRSH
jgi:Rrf2 family iron-sulfur cluster assembly transcriptional regulator